MTIQQTGKKDTSWGYEIVFASTESYCGKLLVFPNAGSKTNMIMHKDKSKSWFINAGKFKITFIDVATGAAQQVIIEEGRTADFAVMSPHLIESLDPNSVIFEVSTADHTEDIFKLSPDVEQTPPPAPQ
jgi:streptogramin lyase